MKELKILHTADWHIGKRLQEYSRLQEQRDVLNEIVDIANDQHVDLVLVAGDLFDVFHPAHDAHELFYQILYRLSCNGTRPVIAIAGNHDSHLLIEAPLPLSRELGILLLGANHQPSDPIKNAAGISIAIPESGIVLVEWPDGRKANVIVAPYANEQLLKQYLGEEEREDELRDILKEKWNSLSAKYQTSDSVNLFMGHFFFIREGGSSQEEPESERSILHVGGAQAMFTDHLPDALQYAALGHLHRNQIIDNRRFPVVYSSSRLSYSFGEASQEKCVVLIKAKPGEKVEFENVILKSGFSLERVTFDEQALALEWLEANQESYVELTFITDEGLDSATRKAIMSAHPRIVHLIPQLKNRTTETEKRVEASDLQEDIQTLFKKYYVSQKGLDPNEELMTLFREVLGEGGKS